MKIYELIINDKLVAYAKDDFLLKLYLSQRGKTNTKFSIRKKNISKSDYLDLEILLYYYNGFALTSLEMEYIDNLGEEHKSFIDNQIILLEVTLNKEWDNLRKSERKALQKSIRILKKKRELNEEEIVSAIDTIIDTPYIVSEYMEQIQFIKHELRGEW